MLSAEVLSRLDPTSPARDDGKQPDGLSLVPWSDGRCLVWSFTCPSAAITQRSNAVSQLATVDSSADITGLCVTHSVLFESFLFDSL